MQPTTGDAPDMRRRFCGGVSWPEDQSSYNMQVSVYKLADHTTDDAQILLWRPSAATRRRLRIW